MTDAPRPILNLDDAPSHAVGNGERFGCTMHMLASPLGASAIGANVTRVPPGKAAFPLHHHHANEEHFFVLSGTGVLRVGDQEHPVRPHDYVFSAPGGPEHAHQFVNTGAQDLVYLAVSTMVVPEVVGYPDSSKTGVRIASGQDPGARFLVDDAGKTSIGYWDGENGDEVSRIVGRK